MSLTRAFIGATLIDGRGGEPLKGAAVVVTGSNISYAGPARSLPSLPRDAVRLDATGLYVLPGIVDCHLHLCGVLRPDLVAWVLEPERQQAMLGARDAEQLLAAGVTTVCDVSRNGTHLRDLVSKGLVRGPRIVPCGPGLAKTGSFNGDSPLLPISLVRKSHPYSLIADGPNDLVAQVRELARQGVECIKVWATGSLGRRRANDTGQELSDEELRAVASEAHHMGLPLHAHCMGLAGGRAALEAGVDVVVHGYCLDEAALSLMARRGTILVATPKEAFTPYDFSGLVVGADLQTHAGANLSEKKATMLRTLLETATSLRVPLVLGSDSYCESATPFGEHSLASVRSLVDYGLSEADAVCIATSAGAAALGLDAVTGTVEAGKSADVLILRADPLEDIENLTRANVELVLASGRVNQAG